MASLAATAVHAAQTLFDEKCGQAPYGPAVPNASTLDQKKFRELKVDVVGFLAASDLFQDCLLRVLAEGPPKPKKDTTQEQYEATVKKFQQDGERIAWANQKEKESVGTAYNAVVDEMNGAKSASTPKVAPQVPGPAAAKIAAPVSAPLPQPAAAIEASVKTIAERPTAKAKPRLKPNLPAG
jgi:hypothetical protein